MSEDVILTIAVTRSDPTHACPIKVRAVEYHGERVLGIIEVGTRPCEFDGTNCGLCGSYHGRCDIAVTASDEPRANSDVLAGFADWLCREMPAGTVVGDPRWWAPRLLRAVEVFQKSRGPELDANGLSHEPAPALATEAVVVKWGAEPPYAKRFTKGRKLYINGKLFAEFYNHEEDGSLGSVEEVLAHLAKLGAIKVES